VPASWLEPWGWGRQSVLMRHHSKSSSSSLCLKWTGRRCHLAFNSWFSGDTCTVLFVWQVNKLVAAGAQILTPVVVGPNQNIGTVVDYAMHVHSQVLFRDDRNDVDWLWTFGHRYLLFNAVLCLHIYHTVPVVQYEHTPFITMWCELN